MLPAAFVWTKMGAESGEALDAIVHRKEFERQMGAGLFAWGIGNALGEGVTALGAEVAEPVAIFSVMPSKPKAADVAPSSVLLWTAYVGPDGAAHPLPAHMVITSRGHVGENAKARHYALFCRSDSPLTIGDPSTEPVIPVGLRNFRTGTPVGASQVTAVVRQASIASADGRPYPVAFAASLAAPKYVRLLAPRMLSANDVTDMAHAALGLDAWVVFVRRVRNQGLDFEVLERGNFYRADAGVSRGHQAGTY